MLMGTSEAPKGVGVLAPPSTEPGHRSGHRRLATLIVCLAIALLGFFAVSYYFQLLRIASVLGFGHRKPRALLAYDSLFNHVAESKDLTIPGTLGPVNLRIYSATGVRNPAPIILVHGFAKDGNRDPYLNDVAVRLAPMGFYVVLPTIPGEVKSEMTLDDLSVIDDTIRWTAESTHQKVSVLGVSFGGGLVVPAAARPNVSKYVKLIICLSGYNDLETIGHYFIHDRVLDPSGQPYKGYPPGPLLIALRYLDELFAGHDLSSMAAVIDRYNQNNWQPLPPDDPVLSRLSEQSRMEYEQLQTVQTEQMKERYRKLLERHREEFKAMSPSSVLPTLKIPIYILHGKADPVFPPGEAEWMRQELRNNPKAHVLITPWIGHVFVGVPSSRLDHWRTMQFCTEMLGEAAHRQLLSN